MRKSTIFISAVLTTFALAMLYGVVSAYRNLSIPAAAPTQALETATSLPTSIPTEVPEIITPVQAAEIAAQVVGNTNLLSAETSTFNGLDAYLVTFTNSDFVYVGLDGQILGVQIAPVVVQAAAPVLVSNNNHGGGSDDGDSHADDDDHDDHEDEDDHDEHEDEDD